MTNKDYKQCKRCVMDTSDHEIKFDENGYCNHCTEYINNTSKRVFLGESTEKKLSELINTIKIKGKNKPYDCILGISGGVDSCYVAYVTKKLGLRALCVHMDNGWNSEAAVKNIKYVVEKLGFDYQSYVLDWDEFRNLQLAFLKASVPEIETPTDIAIPAALHKIAAKYNVKYIFSGGNFVTEGILPKSWHYDAKDEKYIRSINKLFGYRRLKTIPLFGYKKEIFYKIIKGIKIIYLLNYVPYSKKDAMSVLEQELHWKNYGGKHYESVYTGFVQSYILPEKFGIDYRKATFSTQICAAEISRDEAVEMLKSKPYNIEKIQIEKEYICKKLEISTEQFEEILKLPVKSFKDYPNNEKLLKYLYKMYFKLEKIQLI